MSILIAIFKWILYIIATLIIIWLLWFLINLVKYRITTSEEIIMQKEVFYKFININFSSRDFFEGFVGNRNIKFTDGTNFYFNKKDYHKLWKNPNPHKMHKLGYTYKVKFKINNLYFGGYSVAQILEINKLNKKPKIQK